MLLFIFLIFLMIFIILCLFFWKKFQSLDKETRIVLDQYTGLIQKTILSILTITVSIVGINIAYQQHKDNKVNFKVLNTSNIGSDAKNSEEFLEYSDGEKILIFSYVNELTENGSKFIGVPLWISNTGNVKDNLKTISVIVDTEEEVVDTFFSEKQLNEPKDSSNEIWIEPRETLKYVLSGEKLIASINSCIKRLEEKKVPDSNYKLYLLDKEKNSLFSGKVKVTIKVTTGSGTEFKLNEKYFDLYLSMS